jgi:hypothetical protein
VSPSPGATFSLHKGWSYKWVSTVWCVPSIFKTIWFKLMSRWTPVLTEWMNTLLAVLLGFVTSSRGKAGENSKVYKIWYGGGVMMFNITFNNISVISWQSVLLVEETGENHQPAKSHWLTWSHNVVSSTPCLRGIRTCVSGIDCIGCFFYLILDHLKNKSFVITWLSL